jgi:hypothetical protein
MTARPKKAGAAGSPLGAGGREPGGHDAMVWQTEAPAARRAAGPAEPAFHRMAATGGVDLAVHPPGGVVVARGGAAGPFDPAAVLRESRQGGGHKPEK